MFIDGNIIVNYMLSQGMVVRRGSKRVNIVYVEGCNADLNPNKDRADQFNDRGLIIVEKSNNNFEIVLNHPCTTEPGVAATWSRAARALGGVARIALGQQVAWRPGFHKQSLFQKGHPALVQVAPVYVHRDRNRDGIRPGDIITTAKGINHHGTRPGFIPTIVGMWSQGCMVRPVWQDHMDFYDACLSDEDVTNPEFIFPSAVLSGKALDEWVNEKYRNGKP